MRVQGSNSPNGQNLYNECNNMMHYHVVLTMRDGSQADGIVESLEPTSVNILVGEDAVYPEDTQRQYVNPTRFRRFRRRNIPLTTLLALSLLPYPYYAPPYSYYPYYSY